MPRRRSKSRSLLKQLQQSKDLKRHPEMTQKDLKCNPKTTQKDLEHRPKTTQKCNIGKETITNVIEMQVMTLTIQQF